MKCFKKKLFTQIRRNGKSNKKNELFDVKSVKLSKQWHSGAIINRFYTNWNWHYSVLSGKHLKRRKNWNEFFFHWFIITFYSIFIKLIQTNIFLFFLQFL